MGGLDASPPFEKQNKNVLTLAFCENVRGRILERTIEKHVLIRLRGRRKVGRVQDDASRKVRKSTRSRKKGMKGRSLTRVNFLLECYGKSLSYAWGCENSQSIV